MKTDLSLVLRWQCTNSIRQRNSYSSAVSHPSEPEAPDFVEACFLTKCDMRFCITRHFAFVCDTEMMETFESLGTDKECWW